MTTGVVVSASADANYDAYLGGCETPNPFHRRAWGDAVARACGHRQHHLVALRADRPVGILPLTEIRSLLFGKSLVSNGFAVEGGALADDAAALSALAGAAADLARKAGIQVVEWRGGATPQGWTEKDDLYATFAREIPADEDECLKAIPRKQRADVRKAISSDLTSRTGRGERDLTDHYAVYSASVRNLGTPVFPRALFRRVLEAFGEDADILTVLDGDRPVASVLSVYDRGTVFPFWGGGIFEARALKANERMYWDLMRHAAARGADRFDFGRSKVGTGAYSYKKNWGFTPEPLSYSYWLADGAEIPERNPNSPRYKTLTETWSRLPLWAANLAGPYIARNLG